MIEEQKEILKQASVPESWWELCIIKDGVIYTPSMEVLHENNLVSEEEYQYWLSQQEQKIDICEEGRVKTNEELTEENKLLKEQVKALSEANEFQENLIVEMAEIVYA